MKQKPNVVFQIIVRIIKETRMHSSRIRTARTVTIRGGGCLPAWGVCAQGDACLGAPPQAGCLPGWAPVQGGACPGGYHVTYPIIHLMLPVCYLLTN